MLVLGLISGTSLDGIDAAVTEVNEDNGALRCELRSFDSIAYSRDLQRALFALLDAGGVPAAPLRTVRDMCALNFAVGEEFAAAAQRVIAAASQKPELIASHGQTLYHLVRPDGESPFERSTLQIGEAAVIAQRNDLTTIADFRVADVAAGGQGAPLVSYADFALLRSPSESRALLNIGGIANVTLAMRAASIQDLRAFDTGPGNMLIDRAVRSLLEPKKRFDDRGEVASSATVHAALLQWLLAHTYFSRPAPKTTGHEEFGAGFFAKAWSKAQALGCGPHDFVATLTALTARTIADAIPDGIDRIIISGGGAHNEALLDMLASDLRERFSKPPTLSFSSDFGLPIDAKEAMAFALLGFLAVRGRHNSAASCTGARHAVVLGKIVPGANYVQLMQAMWRR